MPVTDWGTAVMTSLSSTLATLFGAIPKILGFLVILLVGWFIAGIVRSVVTGVLGKIKFDEMAARVGIRRFFERMGLAMSPSRLVGDAAMWFIRLVVLVAAFDALGLPAVSQLLQSLILWLPNLVVAIAILVIGGLAASFLSRLVRGSAASAGLTNPDLLATIASVAVVAFAAVIAIQQLGIATNIVNILFAGLVFALALAGGLAFGLGGRDTAARLVDEWYAKGSSLAPRAQRGSTPPPPRMEETEVIQSGNGNVRARS